MKVVGLLRVRNESAIIQESLDHLAQYAQEIYVYDDQSEDDTVKICQAHPSVKEIIVNNNWSRDGSVVRQGEQRQAILELARYRSNPSPDWFIYMDGDERFEERFTPEVMENFLRIREKKGHLAVLFRFFSFCITEEDKGDDIHYTQRRWVDPRYIFVPQIFRNRSKIHFTYGADKRVYGMTKNETFLSEYRIKHYGQARSLVHFQVKKKHYTTHMPVLAGLWEGKDGIYNPGNLVLWDDILEGKGDLRCVNKKEWHVAHHFKEEAKKWAPGKKNQ